MKGKDMTRLTYYTQNTETLLELLYLVAEKAVVHGIQSKGPCSEGKMPKALFNKRIREWLNEKRV